MSGAAQIQLDPIPGLAHSFEPFRPLFVVGLRCLLNRLHRQLIDDRHVEAERLSTIYHTR